ncbi:uncharacterized protein isoform X1 [Rhodnius prolixus]|uniref:uncharacterized protein isoform X1 n=2 Tax=Rhodnius prolixus TaxID=13249 RepID=UPI003D18ABD6
MKMSKVGNQTNSQDPQAVNSRVFVGNLNTFQCSKTDVEKMFQRYGRLAGISMHKGYAFVQFTNPFDARGACLGEDGRTVLGQTLDVNMVAEPKPHQTGRKRQNVAKTGNDWDYYYDSYYSSGAAAFSGSRLAPPMKRPRLLMSARQNSKSTSQQTSHTAKLSTSPPPQVKTYSNPDILICGNCREMFTELQELLEHKKEFCKLRFTCKCSSLNGNVRDIEEGVTLMCVQCKERFTTAWDLMVHVQAAHMLNVYELSSKVTEDRLSSPQPNANNGQQRQPPEQIKDVEDQEKMEPNSDDDTQSESPESCITGALSIEPSRVGSLDMTASTATMTNGSSVIKASE